MSKTKKTIRHENALIQYYLDECFSTYALDNKKDGPFKLFKKGELDKKVLEHSAMILGITPEEILSRDKSAAERWGKKFPFAVYYRQFESAEFIAGKGEDWIDDRLLQIIFGESVSMHERYDVADVHKRVIEFLKKADKFMPGVYHEGAEIQDFEFNTNQFFSFPKIKEMLESLYYSIARAKELYFKIWHGELNESEILEYNFLVSVLDLFDAIIPRKLYYANLKRMIPVYRNQGFSGKEEELNDLVRIKFLNYFKPWSCREFVDSPELAQKYADLYPLAKRKMFDFGESVKTFECYFKWSDVQDHDDHEDIYNISQEELDKEIEQSLAEQTAYEETGVCNFLNITKVCVNKTDAELGEDKDYCEKLIRLGGVCSKGGVFVKMPVAPKYRNDPNEMFERFVAWGESK